MNESNQQPEQKMDPPVPLLEIPAFPSSLKEQPWFKEIEVPLDADNATSFIQIAWARVEVDLSGLGRIEVYPTLLEIHLKNVLESGRYSLTLYDQEQHEIGAISPPSLLLEQPVSLLHETRYLLKMASTSQQSELLTVQVRLHTFNALVSLSSRNLWWLENGEEYRKWQGNEVTYTDPHYLLGDLETHMERFVDEAGVIGHLERREKMGYVLFALGRVAQALGEYSQAIQFYGKSEQKFHSRRDKETKENILLIMRDLFLRQGKKEQAKHVAFQLLNLRASQ
jgi:tetratricopeptide (TPR) repeat protein